MKQQNGVILVGRLTALRALEAQADGLAGVIATLVTDHPAYGGHHCVVFPAHHAANVLHYWELTQGHLEVAVDGWLRSLPSATDNLPAAVVVADRVIYLTATADMRDEVARRAARGRSPQHCPDPAQTPGDPPAGRDVRPGREARRSRSTTNAR